VGTSGWSVAVVTDKLPEREISDSILTVVGGDAPDLAVREPDPSLSEAEQRELDQAYQKEWKDEVDRSKIETGGIPITVQSILHIVWYIGIAAMALWFFAANLRFARKLRRTRVPLDGAESKYPVYLCDDIPSPCLFGLFRPAIYVTSAAAKDESRLHYVIAHEETHARHLDPLWSLVRSVCLAVCWFNPLVWLAAHCSRADCELACDEGVLARLGEAERVPYGETLLALVPVRRGGDPMLAATTMTAGKRQMKERIQRIAENKRPLAVALVAALALTGIVCAATFTGAKQNDSGIEQIAVNLPDAGDEQLIGAYANVEDYIDAVRAKLTSMTYYASDGSGEKSANVLDTRVAFLKKDGELSGLAPDGTLELYNYKIETKIDVPLADVALVGGMYGTEDGWCDLEGQGGHSLVVLRHADGSVDALFDHFNNDNRGGLYYYEESAEEMLYDFYVKQNGLDLPLYAIDLMIGGANNVPGHRVDGDGWYVYIPVRTWWYRADEDGTARWYSRYNTGSTISISEASREEMTAERPQLAAGQAERFVEAPDGRIWRVWTQYDPALLIRSDMTGLEPAVLDAMAESFTVIADSTAQEQPQNPASRVRALLDSVCGADGAGEPIALRLSSVDGESTVESVSDEDARASGNFRFFMNYLFRSVDVSFEPTDLPTLDENAIELTILSTGDRLRFWEGTNNLLWIDRSGTERSFRLVYAVGDTVAGDLMRDWYDEAEYNALGGDDRKQNDIVIPDRGQTWLEAAQEFCERFEGIHLQASVGSKYKYTFVDPTAAAAEEQTAHFRSIGNIDENTWCFFLSTAFVPENERALNWSMAGNTGDYTGSDPDVPNGAYEYARCGYAHRVSGGWRCEIAGTGW
ncbi:MAG: M56 family metallopeptidase, partial [Oscillospiraceae bacterium]|nr:M56 family metallopeptidase [Oscillospiraceae bacterium]